MTCSVGAELDALTGSCPQVIGSDLHIRYGGGVHETKLTSPVIARVLGVQGTGRNIQTVEKLTKLAGG